MNSLSAAPSELVYLYMNVKGKNVYKISSWSKIIMSPTCICTIIYPIMLLNIQFFNRRFSP